MVGVFGSPQARTLVMNSLSHVCVFRAALRAARVASSRVYILLCVAVVVLGVFFAHSCFKGWLKAHLFKTLPGKVDNVSSHLLDIIKEQELMIVSFYFNSQNKETVIGSFAELECFLPIPI